jgi:hypothetical protein
MRLLKFSKAFTLMESGPVVLVTTNEGNKNNIMTISWTMVLDFAPQFAITTGEWNYSSWSWRPLPRMWPRRRERNACFTRSGMEHSSWMADG